MRRKNTMQEPKTVKNSQSSKPLRTLLQACK